MIAIFGIMKVLSFKHSRNLMKNMRFKWLASFMICLALTLGISYAAKAGILSTVEDGGLKEIGSEAYKSNVNTVMDPRITVARAINRLLGFLGIIMVALLMYSGFQYMTAEGDKGKIDTAKKRIINATIGLIIILSSYAITTFVMECSAYAVDRGILTNLVCQ